MEYYVSRYRLAVLDILTSITMILVANCNVQTAMLKYQRVCSLSVMIAGLPPVLSAYTLLLMSVDRVHAVSKLDRPNGARLVCHVKEYPTMHYAYFGIPRTTEFLGIPV